MIAPSYVVGFSEFDKETERERLRKLSDNELIREGQAARHSINASGRRPACLWSGYDCYERSRL
jgi:hypothetical protein